MVHVRQLFDLTGRVAIVTGGSSGLGEQVAAALLEAGAAVVIAARRKERLDAAAQRLQSLGGQVLAVSCDVSTPEGAKSLVETALQSFGRVDILVNNAGVTWGAPAESYPLTEWERILKTNLTGVFLCSQAAGQAMIRQGKGKIVNVASVMGFVGGDPAFMDAVAYNASKGAIIALTRDLAVKWARYNVNVNALAPGWFTTHMTESLFRNRGNLILERIPMKRFGNDTDLKGAVVFLSSDAADYVTGHVLCVDGGYLAW